MKTLCHFLGKDPHILVEEQKETLKATLIYYELDELLLEFLGTY